MTTETEDTKEKQISPEYTRWLKNAYEYYHGDGTFYDMSDAEWDHHARIFAAAEREKPGTYPELKDRDYDGGSLFWLARVDYPKYVTT